MSKTSILLVDDEIEILEQLELMLESYTENIFTAKDGLEGLKILENQEINCVVCDIKMPKMNGVELIKKIRDQGNNVPFIFYTAHGSHELMLEVAKYGAFDFLNKPFFDRLEETVQRALDFSIEQQQGIENLQQNYVSDYRSLLESVNKKS